MSGSRSEALEAARLIVDAGAVYTRADGEPFFFTSGWASPVFVDVKKLISIPEARKRLIELALARIAATFDTASIDQIAGCELAGVPYAAIIADHLAKPLVVALKQGRGFGRLSRFEGTFEPGTRTLLLDDLTTDGRTKTSVKNALAAAQAEVVGIFVLFDYAIFPTSETIASVATLADVLEIASQDGRMERRDLDIIAAFHSDAPAWSRRHGGIAAERER